MTQQTVVISPNMNKANYYDHFIIALKHYMKSGRPRTTEAWLGKKCGLSQAMISAILTKKRKTNPENQVKIAAVFELDFFGFCNIGKRIANGLPTRDETEENILIDLPVDYEWNREMQILRKYREKILSPMAE